MTQKEEGHKVTAAHMTHHIGSMIQLFLNNNKLKRTQVLRVWCAQLAQRGQNMQIYAYNLRDLRCTNQEIGSSRRRTCERVLGLPLDGQRLHLLGRPHGTQIEAKSGEIDGPSLSRIQALKAQKYNGGGGRAAQWRTQDFKKVCHGIFFHLQFGMIHI